MNTTTNSRTHRNRHLRANITKLRPNRQKQIRLLPKRPRINRANLPLHNMHIRIRNLRHRRQKEQQN
jgi:hypothetical protein